MLIVMRHGATEEEIQKVVAVIKEMGYQARPMPGAQRTAVGLVGNDGRVDASRLEGLAGVQEVIHVSKPYKQVSREWKGESTVIRLGEADRDRGPTSTRGRRRDPAGRRVEAAQLPLHVPRSGPAGPQTARPGTR